MQEQNVWVLTPSVCEFSADLFGKSWHQIVEFSASHSFILTFHHSNASNCLGTPFSHDNNESKFTQKFVTRS